MESDITIQSSTVLEILLNQINILLSVISRPVVLWQIFTFLVILLIAWLAPEGYQRWRKGRSRRTLPEPEGQSRWQRWSRALYHLVTPILALVLLQSALLLFALQGYPNGLLGGLTSLVWIWLIYRGLLTLIAVRYGEAARPYQNRILTPIFLFWVTMRILGILPGSIAIADATIGFGSISVSLGKLVTALIVLYIFIVTAWFVKLIMIKSLPSRLGAEPGVIESIAALTGYALLAVGVIVSLGIIGLNFASLAIIAGGLSVGIGIGLQDLVANFVSGLVLLFEQSLRPGDVVELDGRISRVEKISLRATTVRTGTNEELIIPNANFTTNLVKNYTKSDRLVQVIVPLGVSYKSDPELVRQLAIETGLQHPLVLP